MYCDRAAVFELQCSDRSGTYFFFRQPLMKVLRASPFSACLPASALQAFMRSCWVIGAATVAAAPPFKQLLTPDL